jgi:hypothetical protein
MKSFDSALDQPSQTWGGEGLVSIAKAMLLEAQQAAPPWSDSFFC